MNTEFDPLEAELRSLRPRDPSPELQDRIAGELSDSQPLPGWLWSAQPPTARLAPRYFAVASILAASLLAIALFIRQDTRRTSVAEPPPALSPVAARFENAFDAALPSAWQLRSALDRSAGNLDAVLDQHAARTIEPATTLVQIRGLGRFNSNLDTLLGEL